MHVYICATYAVAGSNHVTRVLYTDNATDATDYYATFQLHKLSLAIGPN